MTPDQLISIVGTGLSALAESWPTIYKAFVPDGRTPQQIIDAARAEVQKIPLRPIHTALDAYEHEITKPRGQD